MTRPARRHPLRAAASRALSLAARGWVRASGRAPRILLTYHRVGDEEGALPARVLEDQILAARAAGFQIVVLSRMIDWLRSGAGLPPKAVALTFDDGLADTARVAGPILRRHGVRATVFPILQFLDGPRRYASARQRTFLLEHDGDPGTVPYDYMSWDDLDAWVEAGGEVGGHTLTHPFLGEVDAATGVAEIGRCRSRLAARYGRPPGVFCYPYGDDGGAAGTWVRQAGFEAAVTSRPGVLNRKASLFHLPRLAAHPTAGRPFVELLCGVFRWRHCVRNLGLS
ncbi:MAG: polysaccharide deacetylase family protein [Acidobacteriota bacterium]